MKKQKNQTGKLEWNTEAYPMAAEETYYESEQEESEGAAKSAPSKISGKYEARKKKKRKKKHYLLKFLIFIVLCVLFYLFLHSSVFNIKKITTESSQRFTSEQIQKMAGLKKGMNLFEFRCSTCENRLEEDPYIKEADVKRKLPSGVEVRLTERKEAAAVYNRREYLLVDSEEIVLAAKDKEPRVTILAGVTVTKAEPGEPVQVKEEGRFRTQMKILKAMTAADLYFKKIEVTGSIVKAYVTDSLVCRGKAENMLTGMEEGNLQAVLYDLNKRNIKKGTVTIGDEQYYSFSKKIR